VQVALAAATYELPRLKRKWTHLERQMGSGAMRAGMGESQKEIDKRLLRCAATTLHPVRDGTRRTANASYFVLEGVF
jgi:50S ribosomal subunit-associated GTPase HflX